MPPTSENCSVTIYFRGPPNQSILRIPAGIYRRCFATGSCAIKRSSGCTPWAKTAKATYSLHPLLSKALSQGSHSREPENTNGGLHVGEGTNLHVVKWVQHSPPVQPCLPHRSYRELEIWTSMLAKEPSTTSDTLGLRSLARLTRATPSKAVWWLVCQIDPRHDFRLLEATEKRRKDTFRRGSRPSVLPGLLDNLPITFAAT